MKKHFLMMRRNCPFCRRYFGVVEKFNALVRPENRIRIIDTTDLQDYEINMNPIVDLIEWEGTPTLYMDGITLEGATTKHYIEGFLKSYFESIGEKFV